MRTTQYNRRGFTILELVLTIGIIAVIIGLVTPILMGGIRSYSLVSSHREILSETRFAVDRMIDEIVLIPSTDSITNWTGTNLTFDTQSESYIDYEFTGSSLKRSGISLVDNVSYLNFSYLDVNGSPAASKEDIISIAIEIEVDAGGDLGSLRLKTMAYPRGFSNAYGGFK